MRRMWTVLVVGLSAACTSGPSVFDGAPGGPGGASSTTAVTSTSAGAGGMRAGQPAPSELFGSGIDTIALEVDYEAKAEPYTGSVPGFGELWDVTESHLEVLFEGTGNSIVVPRQIAAMQGLGALEGDDYDEEAIFAIAEQHRDFPPRAGGTASLYLVWLDGRYVDDEGVQGSTLGIAWAGSGIIAMFKPVIAGTSLDPLRRFVEQAVLVHELGHTAGLVDNGLPLTSDHKDTEHGAHCSNQDCIMYWTVDGTSGAVEYVQKSLTDSQVILWGSKCLQDAAAAVE